MEKAFNKKNLNICFDIFVTNTGGKLPTLLLTPAVNLPLVSKIKGGALDLAISPRKNRNGPYCLFRGLGEDDSCKNLKQKIS
jgi:hypothetical protein